MKKKIGELLFQIIPVMIGVYLGFLLSNWSIDNQKTSDQKKFISNLITEIKLNKANIENRIDYHTMLYDSSMYYNQPDIVIKKPRFYQGTQIIKLMNNAFNTGIQTGIINDLSIDLLQSLNELYNYQNDFNEYRIIMMTELISKDFSNNQQDLKAISRFLALTMSDIISMEKDLLLLYDEALKQLELE